MAEYKDELTQWKEYNPTGTEKQFRDESGWRFSSGDGLSPGGYVQDANASSQMVTDPNTGQMIPYSVLMQRERNAQEEKRVADLKARGLNPDGTPVRPDYESWLDPETGMMQEQYQMNMDEILLDPNKMAGYQALQKEATREGPSAWAELTMDKQRLEEQGLRDAALRQSMTAEAQARSGAAMRGGLTGGMAATMGSNIGREALRQRQETARQGQMARLGTQTEDEKNRLASLGQFTGLESGLAQYNTGLAAKGQEFNITRALEEKRLGSNMELEAWKQEMANIAAKKEADAISKSGGGGGK